MSTGGSPQRCWGTVLHRGRWAPCLKHCRPPRGSALQTQQSFLLINNALRLHIRMYAHTSLYTGMYVGITRIWPNSSHLFL